MSVSESGSFSGEVVLVTGGSQGLGRAVAETVRGQGAAGLVLVGRDEVKGAAVAEELTTGQCEVVFVAADFADAGAPARAVEACRERFGTVHAVVNCAAKTDRGSVWDADAALWDEMLAVNVRAPALLTSEAARLMVDNGVPGSILHVGSVAGFTGAPMLYAYATSKGALPTLVRNAARALLRHRIRVNLVQPGWMDTPAEDVIQRRYHGAEDGWLESASAALPFGRLIDPFELARLIAYLSSEDAGLMTGAVIDYDQTVLDVVGSDLEPVWGEPGAPTGRDSDT